MKRKRWSSLDQRASANYAAHRPSTGSSITGTPDAWEALLGRKWVGQTMRFSFTPNATSGWSVTVQTLMRKGGWSEPMTAPPAFLYDFGMDGSS